MGTFLGVVGGGLITIATAFLIEYLRKPKLRISIEHPPLDRPNSAGGIASRHLRLRIHNDISNWFAPWMLRASAAQCRGTITFHHLGDGQNVFGKAMEVRWANSPEPITVTEGTRMQVAGTIAQPERLFKFFSWDSRIDVYPGEAELVDVAVRYEKEKECYGWNNEAYLHNWRTPHWKLGPGRYLVKIVITSAGQKCEGTFRLVNDVDDITAFRLEKPLPEDGWRAYSDSKSE